MDIARTSWGRWTNVASFMSRGDWAYGWCDGRLVEDDLQTQRAGHMIGEMDLHVEDDLQMVKVGQMLSLMNHLVEEDLQMLEAG